MHQPPALPQAATFSPRHGAGIFFLSAAAVALEIYSLRFFSIAGWYHFAAMVLSIAMFGLSVAGVVVALRRNRRDVLPTCLLLFPFAAVGGIMVLNRISFDPYRAASSLTELLKLLPYYLLLGLPLFLFGLAVVQAFTAAPHHAGRIYFYNLTGSALGAIVVIPLLAALGGKAIFAIAALPLAAVLLFPRARVVATAAAVLLLAWSLRPFDVAVSPYKELAAALRVPGAKLLWRHADARAQVDVVASSFTRYAPGLSLTYRGRLPEQLGVLTDGGGMNAITRPDDGEFLEHLPSAIGYHLNSRPTALVLNAGVGLDVLAALNRGAHVTAVEANPTVVALLRGPFRDFSGDLYGRVNVVVDEGRAFLARSGRFDLIVLSLAGNVLADAAGFTGLQENYLLTAEAFRGYLAHLNDGGFLVITRFLSFPPREELRLFALGLSVNPPADRLALFRSHTTVTLVIGKERLSAVTLETIKRFTEENRFDLVFLPGDFTPNRFNRFAGGDPYHQAVQQLTADPAAFSRGYLLSIEPPTDDQPFYFDFFKWRKLPQLLALPNTRIALLLEPGFLLLSVLLQALVLSLVAVIAPLVLARRAPPAKRPLRYFVGLGLAYLFVELFLIQKVYFLLGQIVTASAVVIATLLAASGLGAYLADRLDRRRLPVVLAGISGISLLYAFLLPSLAAAVLPWSATAKLALAVLLTAPLGFLMGLPFPLGLKLIAPAAIPWAWAVNGAASVVSPIAATLLAVSWGYRWVMVAAGILYGASWLALRGTAGTTISATPRSLSPLPLPLGEGNRRSGEG